VLAALPQVGGTRSGAGSPAVTHHRVVQPGGRALEGPGLVRYQAVGPAARPGQPPEFLLVMSFLVAAGEQHDLSTADIARALGAQLTYLLDRRIDVLSETAISMENEPSRLTFLPMRESVEITNEISACCTYSVPASSARRQSAINRSSCGRSPPGRSATSRPVVRISLRRFANRSRSRTTTSSSALRSGLVARDRFESSITTWARTL